jgi:hypothetical protein
MTFGQPLTDEQRAGHRAALVRYLKQQASQVARDDSRRGTALAEFASFVGRQPAGELLIGVIATLHGVDGSDIYAPGEHAGRVLAAYGAEPLPPAGSFAREAVDGEFIGKWSHAAIKDLEEADGVAEARERATRRRRPANYSGPKGI